MNISRKHANLYHEIFGYCDSDQSEERANEEFIHDNPPFVSGIAKNDIVIRFLLSHCFWIQRMSHARSVQDLLSGRHYMRGKHTRPSLLELVREKKNKENSIKSIEMPMFSRL